MNRAVRFRILTSRACILAGILLARWRSPHAAPIRDDYFTPAEHRQEAERLAWVIDDVLQSGARRTLSDLIALARLHADLAGRP